MLEPIRGCDAPSWAKPKGYRLASHMGSLPTESWRELSFSFVPQANGEADLILLGGSYNDPLSKTQQPVWGYVDNIRVEGAKLLNGDFEERQKNGAAVAWQTHVKSGVAIRDPKLAASGEWLVKVAHERRFMQKLKLTAGRAVTVRAKVRGLPVERVE